MESNELVEGLLQDLECPKALGKFGREHGGDVILETGLVQVQCKTSASGKAVWPAKPIDVSIIKTEEKISQGGREEPTFVDRCDKLHGHNFRACRGSQHQSHVQEGQEQKGC
jgi:hypothetical protein